VPADMSWGELFVRWGKFILQIKH